MQLCGDGLILRIYVDEGDMLNGKPLYEEIVLQARELGLAGATVIRGIMGFGANSQIHSAKILRLTEDLPVVIEIVDTEDNIERMMPFLEENVTEGLIALERVEVIQCRKS